MKKGFAFLFVIVLLCTVTICGCMAPTASQQPASQIPADQAGHQIPPAVTAASGTPEDRTDVPITSVIPVGRGHYFFNDSLGNVDRPILVYTYRPASWNSSGPILIVMPGAGREGSGPRETWIPYAETYAALVVVPEFSLQYYPDDLWYINGNTFDLKGWKPKKNWTYMAIEHLFDDIRQRTRATSTTYLLDGHSAGAQFVHRMVMVLPEARVSRAVAANAGMYLLPNLSVPYGYGLKDSPLPPVDLPLVFSKKLIIMSGDADTNPNDSSLARFAEAEAQGPTRFERAKFFIATARTQAAALNVPLNWEYHIVHGVGHDEAGMAGPSAAELFQ